jgi:glycosyltransferase involved in cell wall biosynthesis
MKNYKIGFPIRYFTSWMGGASLLAHFTDAVLIAHKNIFHHVHPFLILDISDTSIEVPDIGFLIINKNQISFSGVLGEFLKITKYESIILYKDLYKCCLNFNIDIVGPSHHDLGTDFPVPWCGYIPDFQHKYFPENFSFDEIQNRNILFDKIVKNSNLIFSNSLSVRDDIHKFYTNREHQFKTYQFPDFQSTIEYLSNIEEIKYKYQINNKYFIVCSQQWVHKNHDIIINAFKNFLNLSSSNYQLVITGHIGDYRQPNYFHQINLLIENLNLIGVVKYIGFTDKDIQLCLIDNSVALIQASIIEGGPGASGVNEAASLDTLIIASDIIVNTEMAYGYHYFFETNNVASLTEKMFLADAINNNRNKNKISTIEIDCINLTAGLKIIRSLISII